MKNLNRISAVITEAEQNKILKDIDALKSKMTFLLNLSVEDRRRLRKFGAKSYEYVNTCMEGALAYPELLPGTLDPAEFKRDIELYAQLNQIYTRVGMLYEAIEDTLIATGADTMNAADTVYHSLKRSSSPDANIKGLLQRISERFARTSKTVKATDNSTANTAEKA